MAHSNGIIFTQTVDIVTIILKNLKQDSVTEAIVNAGVIPKFANLVLMSSGGHSFSNAITSLDLIITASSLYRDEFLKTDVVKHLCKGLKSQHTPERAVQGSCLSIIHHAIEHHSASSKQIVEMMIEYELIPFLIQKATFNGDAEREQDKAGQMYAMRILSVMAREKNAESLQVMAGASTNFITNLVGLLKRECSTACDILALLNQVAESSPYYRGKVMYSGILSFVPSGISSDCSNLRNAWMRLVNTFASGEGEEAAVKAWINTGIVRKLIELKIECKQPIETKTLSVLTKAKARFIEKESSRLDLLQKKKALSNARACQEATEQLQKTVTDMSLLQLSVEPTDPNIQRQLDQMNSQLSRAQAALVKANQEAKKVGSHQNLLEKSSLPNCADALDHEIQHSKLLIEEARALDVVIKSEQESANTPNQKRQSKLLAWMSKGEC